MNKTYFIGLCGHKKNYQPWLFGVEVLEVVNGRLDRACKTTNVIFNCIPEQLRLDPPLDRWLVAHTDKSEDDLIALYFSSDYSRISDILEGMRYSWDVLYASGRKGIENGELTYTDRDCRVDYSPV